MKKIRELIGVPDEPATKSNPSRFEIGNQYYIVVDFKNGSVYDFTNGDSLDREVYFYNYGQKEGFFYREANSHDSFTLAGWDETIGSDIDHSGLISEYIQHLEASEIEKN
jgi:hypothetical protein